jgi:hypothetical protein
MRELTVRQQLDAEGVRIVRKDKSWVMRTLGAVFKLFGYDFMARAWTTIGPKTIYAPTWVPEDINTREDLTQWQIGLLHELVHIKQARKYPVIWQFTYLFVFFPVLLAWFRWRWEREAYLTVNINKFGQNSDEIADTIWRVYLFPWPKGAMKKWFNKHKVR